MARTLTEIEAEMIAAQAVEPGLAGLTSTSKTAIYRLWRSIVAIAQLVLEQMWDAKQAELEALAESAVPGTEKWYAARSLEFQYGYALTESNGKLYYSVIDDAAKIVDKVAVLSNSGIVTIKVAKDNAGTLEKLTSAERVAFQSYINDIKFAGTRTTIVSTDPDLVKLVSFTVYYDGKLNLASFQSAVETAINNYLNGIYFDGALNINKFRDAVEGVSGVEDTGDLVIQCKPDGGSYAAVTRIYNPSSGYFAIDPAFPLSAQITYVAQ